ncbi:MAG: cytochrome b/b6 domain-containing protein, partial [Hyphomicrobiales bacterium]|nr:cytochrome b/b6 domain-containing protein [Hyphomicrobiales bacterium]
MTARSARWNVATRLLHWLSAAAIVAALGLGVWMVRFVDDAAGKFDLYQRHKTLGAAVFALAVARLLVRAATRGPDWPEAMSRARRAAAGAVHGALYASILATA